MMLGPEINVGIAESEFLFQVLDVATWNFGLKEAQCEDERTHQLYEFEQVNVDDES